MAESELEARAMEWADRVTGLLINRTVRAFAERQPSDLRPPTRDILQAEVLPLMAAKEKAERQRDEARATKDMHKDRQQDEIERAEKWREIAEALASATKKLRAWKVVLGYVAEDTYEADAALAAYEKAKSEGAQ